jgi:phenylacetate-coenzyme A ligase PaaK-like adenylate-forming protein
MKLLPRIIGSRRWRQIERFKSNPFAAQERVLLVLLKKAARTNIGREYNYSKIRTIADFQRKIPIRNYDDFKPYIEQALAGKPDIIWPGKITWFAKSSGTTSDKSKYLPITREALKRCHYRAGKDVLWMYYLNYPETKIYRGKSLIVGGSHQISNFNSGSRLGDLSAILIQNLPVFAHLVRTPNLEVTLMNEWESKIKKMAEETIKENVTNISGVPSWTLVLIKTILQMTGKSDLREVWPNLEVFIHGGVSFNPYRAEFARVIPADNMRYLEVYNASEGFFAIQDKKDRDDLLLMLDYGIFYEFIPMDEFHSDKRRALSLKEVELNKNYALVISTNAGLWRYLIGDVVKFTSRDPYRIKITGRTKHFINVFGEELMIDNVEQALASACRQTNASIKDYTVAPVFMDQNQKGRHEWLIEFYQAPADASEFMAILDAHLQQLNSDYEAKRYKNITLESPKLTIARTDLFYDWLKAKGKLGGQHKVPRLSNERNIIEELKDLNNKAKSD